MIIITCAHAHILRTYKCVRAYFCAPKSVCAHTFRFCASTSVRTHNSAHLQVCVRTILRTYKCARAQFCAPTSVCAQILRTYKCARTMLHT